MWLKNLAKTLVTVFMAVRPTSLSASGSTNGRSLDRQGYDSATIVGSVGAISGSPSASSVTFQLQDSADGTSFDNFGDSVAVTAANTDSAELEVSLSGARQFVRVTATAALTGGSSPTALVAASITLGGSTNIPPD